MKKIIQFLFTIVSFAIIGQNSGYYYTNAYIANELYKNYPNNNGYNFEVLGYKDTIYVCSSDRINVDNAASLPFDGCGSWSITNIYTINGGLNFNKIDNGNSKLTFLKPSSSPNVLLVDISWKSTTCTYTIISRCVLKFNDFVLQKPSDLSVCKNDAAFTLATKLYPSATNPANYSFSGNGVVSNSFYPGTVNGTSSISINYALPNFNNGNCLYSQSSNILVTVNPSLVYADTQSVCKGTTLQLNTNANSEVIFSSGNAQTSVSASGLLDITVANGKVVKLNLTRNGCTTLGNMSINVKALPTVSATNISICTDSPTFTYTNGSPAGGVYRNQSTAIETQYIANSQGQAGGSFPFTYTIKGSNGCSNTANFNLVIHTLPTITNSKASDKYCIGSTAISLGDVTPTGGTWSGTGVSANKFSISSTGTYTITYTYKDAFTCTSTTTRNILVNNPSAITGITPIDSLCNDKAPYNLNASPSGGFWTSTSPILISGNAGNVDPSKSLTIDNTLTYNYTDGNGCTSTFSKILRIYDKRVIDFGITQNVCKGSMAKLIVSNPKGGVWSGANVKDSIFNASMLNIGSYSVTYTYKNIGCISSATKNVNVTSPVIVNAGNDTIACRVKSTFDLSGVGIPKGGTWSGYNLIDNVIDPSSVPIGSRIYKYTYSDSFGCTDTDSINITFSNSLGNPIISYGTKNAICKGDSIELNASVPNSTINTTYRWYYNNDPTYFHEGTKVKVTGVADFIIYCESLTSQTNGCPSANMTLQSIMVNKPSGDFFTDKDKIYVGDKVKFTTTVSNSTYNYSFGDSLSSIEKNPVHYYYKADTVDLKLSVVSLEGCTWVFEKHKALIVLQDTAKTPTSESGISNQADRLKTGYLAIYPNPIENEEFLNVDVFGNDVNSLEYTIITNEGYIIYKERYNYTSDLYKVRVNHLTPGSYILQLKFGNIVRNQLLIKK